MVPTASLLGTQYFGVRLERVKSPTDAPSGSNVESNFHVLHGVTVGGNFSCPRTSPDLQKRHIRPSVQTRAEGLMLMFLVPKAGYACQDFHTVLAYSNNLNTVQCTPLA